MNDLPVVWMVCDCYVWPVIAPAYMGSGRCGRCGAGCHGSYQSKRQATDQFFAEHSKLPEKIK